MKESPQFQFWELVLFMELVVFSLVRSSTGANSTLYSQALASFIPFFPTEQQCELNLFCFMYIDPPLNAHLQGFNQFQLGKFVVH